MIRIRADDQPRLRQRTEIRVREILTAREVIRHHAVGQELHARKPRDAPDEVHKPRTLLVVEKERTMADTTRPSAFRSAAPHPSKRFAIVGGYDQVITPVGKVDARFPLAGDSTTNKIYCGNLLWQSCLTLPSLFQVPFVTWVDIRQNTFLTFSLKYDKPALRQA